uniref:Negative elongation factor B (inferred by orthology to a human protein) n=1 Tax=Strongyloides venezuelensis TaxID=75913 RepID=A0A0K0FVU2_STRVS
MSSDPFSYSNELERRQLISAKSISKARKNRDIKETIKFVQKACSINVGAPLDPIFQMLDYHGLRRHGIHEQIFKALEEKMIQTIRILGSVRCYESQAKIEKILSRTFDLHKIPSMRGIVLEALKFAERVDEKYLPEIVENKDLYEACCVTVKQQIWYSNLELFKEEVFKIFDEYIKKKEKVVLYLDSNALNFFNFETSRARKKWKEVVMLGEMAGDSVELYNQLMLLLQQRFMETGCYHYCSLKVEVMVVVFERRQPLDEEVVVSQFACSLDAYVRDRQLESQAIAKIRSIFEPSKQNSKDPTFRSLNELEFFAEMAMIACDPHITHFICNYIIKIIYENAVTKHKMPRDQHVLHVLIKLLHLGSCAHKAVTILGNGEIISTDEAFEGCQDVNTEIYTKFLPEFTCLIIDDLINDIFIQNNLLSRDSFPQVLKYYTPISDQLVNFLEEDRVCALIWMFYYVEILPKGKTIHSTETMNKYLDKLKILNGNLIYQTPWTNFLVQRVICSAGIFDGYLNPGSYLHLFLDQIICSQMEHRLEAKYFLLRFICYAKTVLGEWMTKKYLERLNPKVLIADGNCVFGEEDKANYLEAYDKISKKLAPKTVNIDYKEEGSKVQTLINLANSV